MKNLIFTLLFSQAYARLLPEAMRLPKASEWHEKAHLYKSDKCDCELIELCEPVTQWPDKEVFGFGTNSDHWKYYPWDLITTVAWADDVVVCEAHETQTRVIAAAPSDMPFSSDQSVRANWTKSVVDMVMTTGIDGITFDYESTIPQGDVMM